MDFVIPCNISLLSFEKELEKVDVTKMICIIINFCPPIICFTLHIAWAVGEYCVSLKVLKSPHKEIYSFKLTMLF